MKKIVMLLAVAAMTCFSTSAFAVHEGEGKASGNLADINIGGSIDIRSRDFTNLDMNKKVGDATLDTQERVRLDVNVKAGDVQGKVTIENDWDSFGRFEQPQGDNTTKTSNSKGDNAKLDVREAWMLFPVPSTPVMVKGGHMLLQLGNGWWFRSMKYGSDAWVAFTDIDPVHVGAVNVKISEGATGASDDIDAYVLFATVKASDTMKFGADVTFADDRRNGFGLATGPTPSAATQAYNIGLNADIKAGPVGVKAEADIQTGKSKGSDANKFKGNQLVVQGNVAMDPVTINFALAYGSGKKVTDTSKDYKQMITFLDADPHYTFLYEYQIPGACGAKHQGFCNTTAISAGALFAATNSLSIGADVWFLMASAKVDDKTDTLTGPNAPTSSALGTEVDVKINWKLADNLSWNWTLGYLDPGKGLGKDAALGAQGILSMKF